MTIESLGIIGAGFIGTSLAARARDVWPQIPIVVFDEQDRHTEAVKLKISGVTVAEQPDDLASCSAIFICTPVSIIPNYVIRLATSSVTNTLLVDTGSTKQSIISRVSAAVPAFSSFVPGHPLAGSRLSGPQHAKPDLVVDRTFVLTPYGSTSQEAVTGATQLLEDLGARVVITDAASHDAILALTSHLPHMIAYALAAQLGAAGLKFGDLLQELTPMSFRSMTAFAASDPRMWTDILLDNKSKILEFCNHFRDHLLDIEEKMESGNELGLLKYIDNVGAMRKELE